MDGQDGGYTNLGRTDSELESVDSQNEQKRTESYKVTRTGQDEMAFFLKDDVDQPIEQGALVKRGGTGLGENDRADRRTIVGSVDRHDVGNRRNRACMDSTRRQAEQWFENWVNFK